MLITRKSFDLVSAVARKEGFITRTTLFYHKVTKHRGQVRRVHQKEIRTLAALAPPFPRDNLSDTTPQRRKVVTN